MSLTARRVVVLSALAIGAVLVTVSPPRRVGDGAEYLAMAKNMAYGHRPSLTPEEIARAMTLVPNDPVDLRFAPFVGADGRQDFPHFWFYSFLASPFVRLAGAIGVSPLRGFAWLNLLLWITAFTVVSSTSNLSTVLFVFASPIVWWLDKAHTEVLTISAVAIAVACLEDAPWWSAIAFGAAAAQNPPWAAGVVIAAALAIHDRGWRDRRVVAGVMMGGGLSLLPVIYAEARFGAWSTLARGGYIDQHAPTFVREWTTHLIDPNLGLFANDPILLLAVLVGAVGLIARRRLPRSAAVCLVMVMVCLLAFTQSTNQNGGGTPSMSRYALWLVPLMMPFLELAHNRARVLTNALAGAAVAWCVVVFMPARAEHPLEPTRLAAAVWQQWPALDNPLAEVFVKRVAGNATATPALPVAMPDCGKVLTLGSGAQTEWPARCGAAAIPELCRGTDVECYGNAVAGGYQFVAAPAQPGWRRQIARLRDLHPAWTPPLDDDADDLTASLVDGWFVSPAAHEPFVWIGENAHVELFVTRAGAFSATLDAFAHDRPRRILVSVDGRAIAPPDVIGTTRSSTILPIGTLGPGSHRLRLESLDGADAGSSLDPRRLSIAVRRLTVSRVGG